MKKILIITAFVPSRNAGGTIFTKSLIHDLKKDFSVDVFVITTEHIDNQKSVDKNIVVHKINRFWFYMKSLLFFFLNPLFIRRFSWKTLIQLKKLVAKNNYDVIFFDYSQMFLYSLFFSQEKKILSYHDVMFQKFTREQFPYNLLSFPTYIFEYMFSKQPNVLFITPSEKDSGLLKKIYHQESTFVNYYLNDYVLSLQKANVTIREKKYFVFFGDWSRAENKEGLKWFIECVQNQNILEFEFLIIGKALDEHLQRKIITLKNFTYLGFVENPYEIISNAIALIAPIFKGAGIKIKVIEALACGTPVLGTEIAFEGLPKRFEKYLILCQAFDDYVHFIRKLQLGEAEKKSLRNDFIEYYNTNTAGNFIRSVLN
jgi:glycosyltransferase involved in cell wall biosynthesis